MKIARINGDKVIMTSFPAFQPSEPQPQAKPFPYSKTEVGTRLLASLQANIPPIPPSFPAGKQFEEFPHYVALIVPDSQFHVMRTIDCMTQWFTAASVLLILGTYTSPVKGIEEEINWLVISWCDAEGLEKYWPKILAHAEDLQQSLNQECIAVIRDGNMVLVRQWS